jgi:hypothetical protein
VVERFLAEVRRDRGPRRSDRRTALQILDYLVEQGVVSRPSPGPKTELDLLLDDYREWMWRERGLADTTMRRYEHTARRLLVRRGTAEQGVTTGLTGAEVTAFLLSESQRCSVGAAKGRVAELRSLLRYLFLGGRQRALDSLRRIHPV